MEREIFTNIPREGFRVYGYLIEPFWNFKELKKYPEYSALNYYLTDPKELSAALTHGVEYSPKVIIGVIETFYKHLLKFPKIRPKIYYIDCSILPPTENNIKNGINKDTRALVANVQIHYPQLYGSSKIEVESNHVVIGYFKNEKIAKKIAKKYFIGKETQSLPVGNVVFC
uniref:Uncharacterized protein n=1 Tax=Abalone asfa-like virus TaxID=2839893 RepID=A0A5K7XZ56_9VIRU|nr:hypothetical protein [Abalone asfa-like virus]BCY04529.1 hypothetical protein [Abalone asfa-like virus]